MSERRKPLQEYAARRQRETLDQQGEEVRRAALWLALDAKRQAEMHETEESAYYHFDNLTTQEFVDPSDSTGKNIIVHRRKSTRLPNGVLVDVFDYQPTPFEAQGPATGIDEAVALADAGASRLHHAVRLLGEGITLTYDSGDNSADYPRVSARALDEQTETGFRMPAVSELKQAFAIDPEDF